MTLILSCPTCGKSITEWFVTCSNPIHQRVDPLPPAEQQKWHDALEAENIRRTADTEGGK